MCETLAARRGLPRKLISDNGKAFKTAAKMFTDMLSQPECKRYLTDVGVEWTFNRRLPGGVAFLNALSAYVRLLDKQSSPMMSSIWH